MGWLGFCLALVMGYITQIGNIRGYCINYPYIIGQLYLTELDGRDLPQGKDRFGSISSNKRIWRYFAIEAKAKGFCVNLLLIKH